MRKYLPSFLALLMALGIASGAAYADDDAPADEVVTEDGAETEGDGE